MLQGSAGWCGAPVSSISLVLSGGLVHVDAGDHEQGSEYNQDDIFSVHKQFRSCRLGSRIFGLVEREARLT